ncbi:hypothetical protein LCGC14_1360940 [marine sediment metagenome]|uniref:Uncharacterized protein n=1 Tax=marine sediment metagenome TaxID=412755 RepID=A0A0F9MNK4_9ZZZZ
MPESRAFKTILALAEGAKRKINFKDLSVLSGKKNKLRIKNR